MTNLSDTLAALKPCPFCAKDAAFEKQMYSFPPKHWVHCTYCGMSSSAYSNRESAQKAWNTRTGQLVPVPSVERVARVVADYQMSVGLPPDDAWEDADGIASAVIAAMKEGWE